MFKNKLLGVNIVKNNTIKVVHDDDLEQLLKSLNIYDDVKNGKCRCVYCNSVITLDNIDAILPFEGKVRFTCDNKECHLKLIGWTD